MHFCPESRFPARYSSDPPVLHRWFCRLRPSLSDTAPQSMSSEWLTNAFNSQYTFLIVFDCAWIIHMYVIIQWIQLCFMFEYSYILRCIKFLSFIFSNEKKKDSKWLKSSIRWNRAGWPRPFSDYLTSSVEQLCITI